jgi:hypothetical protein
MTGLAIRLHKENVTTSIGAVAKVRKVADEKGVTPERYEAVDVVVPGTASTVAHHVALNPGRWLIEATLPSGETISEEVAVRPGQDADVTLRSADTSPHNDLGWQYLAGNVEGRKAQATARGSIVGRRPGATPRGPAFESFGGAEAHTVATPQTPLHRPAAAPRVFICDKQHPGKGREAWDNLFAPRTAAAKECGSSWSNEGEQTWLYQVTDNGGGRSFARVEWGDEVYAVSLPLPWSSVREKKRTAVQLMVREVPDDKQLGLGVVVLDPDFAAMSGLMTASTLPSAAAAIDQAYRFLFEKIANPLAAAAGGYVLLAAGKQNESDWWSWIDNLCFDFPGISDGAILRGVLMLRYAKSTSAVDEAHKSFLEAFERGVPYYSAGVSWLLDGLTTFAEDDPAIGERLRCVRRAALRLDLSQAFTVVRVSESRRR